MSSNDDVINFLKKEISKEEKSLEGELTREIEKSNNVKIVNRYSLRTNWLIDNSEEYLNEFRYLIFMNRIIISRVCFSNRHNGCMSRCFEIIKKYAKQIGIDIIEIQCVESYEMMKWCKKHEFVPKEFNIPITDSEGRSVYIGDYYYKVRD